MLMEGGIWGDGVYAFSSSEKPFIYFAPRRSPEFQLSGYFWIDKFPIPRNEKRKPGCPENFIPTLGLIQGVVSLTPKRKYTCMQAMP
jgi:hypothetical protein